MIDTLKLSLTDYSIDRGTSLAVQPGTFNPGTGEASAETTLFSFPDGEQIAGAKAYLNDPLFNLTIAPGKHGVVAYLQCSIPRVLNGTNYAPVDEQGATDALNRVQTRLDEHGIRTNLLGAKISRVDLFRTAVTDHSFSSYAPLFNVLNGKRQKQRSYGTTYLWHNSQQETCIYDKVEEMEWKGEDTGTIPDNSIRFEHRLLKGRKVRAALGMATAHDLLTSFDALGEHYRDAMMDNVFRYRPDEMRLLASQDIEREMRWFMDNRGSRWFDAYLKTVGARSLVTDGTVEIVRDAMANVLADDDPETTRKRLYRLTRQLQDVQRDLAMVSPAASGNLLRLYDELRDKVLGDGSE